MSVLREAALARPLAQRAPLVRGLEVVRDEERVVVAFGLDFA